MTLTTIEQVQKRVGMLPAPRDLKVIDYVDEHALRWLSYSSFGFFTFGRPGDIHVTAAGGVQGFVSVLDSGKLSFPVAALDNSITVKPDVSFGALFMVSGMEETLRVNGKVSGVADGLVSLQVEECYLHCAKSFRRSEFWLPTSIGEAPREISQFIKRSSFLVLGSINRNGQADVSPKGDPESFLIQEGDGFVYFADRPGNRRIDSFRNILEQPVVCLLAVVPGCADFLEVKGIAELCDDEPLLTQFEVQGKKPQLVTRIKPTSVQMVSSRAIANSALWPAQQKPEDLVPSEIFKAHIKQSKESSLQAKIARAAVSLPGAMEKGLELDYKHNLY